MQGQSNWRQQYKNEICTRTDIFLNRKDASGQPMTPYPPTVTSSIEYTKMKQYLSTIRSQAAC